MHTTLTSTLKRLVIPALVAVVLITIAMPKTARFGYDYRKGTPWKYEDLIAQMDFPIYKTEEQILDDYASEASSVVPYYRYSETVLVGMVEKVGGMPLSPRLRSDITEVLEIVYERGVVNVKPESDVVYIQKGKRAEKYPTSEIYAQSEARDYFLSEVNRMSEGVDMDSLFRKEGVYDLIVPNLAYDAETTNLIASQNEREVSPTLGYVHTGTLIVSSGEIVTTEIAQILDSYRKEYEQSLGYNHSLFALWAGSAVISLCLVLILFATIYFAIPSVLLGWRRYTYIVTVFTLSAVSTLLMVRFLDMWICIVPFTMSALYLQAFFKNSEIVPVYVVCLIPLLLFAHNGPALFVMYLLAGFVAVIMFRRFQSIWQQFVTAIVTFAVLAVVYFAFHITGMFSGNVLFTLRNLFFASILTVCFYPLTYLFEMIFNLISVSRLRELSDTSNPVLHELELKAPGTFQHSLQVMNMADAAARAIGAHVELVRVGALYHDIGKVCNPLCFVENESVLSDNREKYHDTLTPRQSAGEIIRHVTDGVAIAKKHRLPFIIPDFILTHHGTTRASYFYSKYLEEGGSSEDVAAFTYPGPKPSTKEQIILMLCDGIEAASRTLKDYSAESFDAFVEKMVASKMEDGQFENSDISIKEIGMVKEAIKNYLAQMYHARIEYPEETKTNKQKSWKSKQTSQTH